MGAAPYYIGNIFKILGKFMLKFGYVIFFKNEGEALHKI